MPGPLLTFTVPACCPVATLQAAGLGLGVVVLVGWGVDTAWLGVTVARVAGAVSLGGGVRVQLAGWGVTWQAIEASSKTASIIH
jgi:hypothetical protein